MVRRGTAVEKKIWLQIGLRSSLNLNKEKPTEGNSPRTLLPTTATVNTNSFRFPFNTLRFQITNIRWRRNYHTKSSEKLNFEKIKIKKKPSTTFVDHKNCEQHSFLPLSAEKFLLLISNSMNANRDLPQYYYITFASFSYDCFCWARRKVLSCAADKNYHNRILVSIFNFGFTLLDGASDAQENNFIRHFFLSPRFTR